MEILWLKEAIQDLKEIGRLIAEDDPAAVYRVLTKIETLGDSLLHNPHRVEVAEWQTRTFEGRVGKPVRVQVLAPAPNS